jgi:hypothetical protein
MSGTWPYPRDHFTQPYNSTTSFGRMGIFRNMIRCERRTGRKKRQNRQSQGRNVPPREALFSRGANGDMDRSSDQLYVLVTTLCVVTHGWTLRDHLWRNPLRQGRFCLKGRRASHAQRSHAERGNEQVKRHAPGRQECLPHRTGLPARCGSGGTRSATSGLRRRILRCSSLCPHRLGNSEDDGCRRCGFPGGRIEIRRRSGSQRGLPR